MSGSRSLSLSRITRPTVRANRAMKRVIVEIFILMGLLVHCIIKLRALRVFTGRLTYGGRPKVLLLFEMKIVWKPSESKEAADLSSTPIRFGVETD
jgi:hypothetical protein